MVEQKSLLAPESPAHGRPPVPTYVLVRTARDHEFLVGPAGRVLHHAHSMHEYGVRRDSVGP